MACRWGKFSSGELISLKIMSTAKVPVGTIALHTSRLTLLARFNSLCLTEAAKCVILPMLIVMPQGKVWLLVQPGREQCTEAVL